MGIMIIIEEKVGLKPNGVKSWLAILVLLLLGLFFANLSNFFGPCLLMWLALPVLMAVLTSFAGKTEKETERNAERLAFVFFALIIIGLIGVGAHLYLNVSDPSGQSRLAGEVFMGMGAAVFVSVIIWILKGKPEWKGRRSKTL